MYRRTWRSQVSENGVNLKPYRNLIKSCLCHINYNAKSKEMDWRKHILCLQVQGANIEYAVYREYVSERFLKIESGNLSQNSNDIKKEFGNKTINKIG